MQVSVKDVSKQCAHFCVMGKGAEQLLRGLGAQLPEAASEEATSTSASQPPESVSSEHACFMQQVGCWHAAAYKTLSIVECVACERRNWTPSCHS